MQSLLLRINRYHFHIFHLSTTLQLTTPHQLNHNIATFNSNSIMKFNTLILATTSLVVVVAAAATTSAHVSLSLLRNDNISVTAPTDASAIDTSTSARSNDDCETKCKSPLVQCMRGCGSSPLCKKECGCKLFDGHERCVIRGTY